MGGKIKRGGLGRKEVGCRQCQREKEKPIERGSAADLAMATKEIIVFAASLVAASSAALAAANADDRVSIPCTTKDGSGSVSQSSSGKKEASGSGSRKFVEDKFAPRLDGLRFIETLVTAHR